jgi:hypothetical protein
MKSVPTLIKGEKAAIRDYGAREHATKDGERKLMHHIRGEEKGHAKELKGLLKRSNRKSSRR